MTRPRLRLLVRPRGDAPTLAHNWAASQREGMCFGALDGVAAFLGVLLARLGATSLQVGVLTALPNLAVFLLAIPFGSFVQRRRNAVPWYSRGRALGQLMVPAVGMAVLVLPADQVVVAIIGIVAVASVFQAFADLLFWVVMDGVAGPGGRYELLGQRLGLKGGVSAVTQLGVGAFLARAAFPLGYGVAYVLSVVPIALAYRYSRTLRVPDHVPVPRLPPASLSRRVATLAREVAGERPFRRFVGIHVLFSFGVRMALPVLPLWYVRELGASDAFIGLLGTATAAMMMIGHFTWRRPARRFGGPAVLGPAALGAAAFPLLLTVVHRDVLVVPLVGLYAFCLAGVELALFDALMGVVPADRSVRFAAIDTGAVNLAGVLGPLTGAAVAAAWGLAPALAAAGVIGLAGAALLALTVTDRLRRLPRRRAPSA